MKLIKLSFIILLCHFKTTAQVREILDAVKPQKAFAGRPILQKKSQIFQFGISTPNNVASLINIGGVGSFFKTSSSKSGPIFLSYEYLVKENIGIGATVLYAKASQTYKDPFSSNTQTANLSGTSLLLNSTYHFYITDKIDPYSKISLGVTLWKGSYTNQNGSNAGTMVLPTPVSYSGLIGMRYFTKNNLLGFGEISYSNLKFTANIGIGVKLK